MMLQVAQLIVSVVAGSGYLLFFLLPFILGTWTEMRRVAELLAQLPQDVDVEAIVSRTLGVAQPRAVLPYQAHHQQDHT